MKKVKAFILVAFGTFALLGGIATYLQKSAEKDIVEQRPGEEIQHEYKERNIIQHVVSIGFMLVGGGLIVYGIFTKRGADRENQKKQ